MTLGSDGTQMSQDSDSLDLWSLFANYYYNGSHLTTHKFIQYNVVLFKFA